MVMFHSSVRLPICTLSYSVHSIEQDTTSMVSGFHARHHLPCLSDSERWMRRCGTGASSTVAIWWFCFVSPCGVVSCRVGVSRPKRMHWLVVEPYPSEKYEPVNWDDDYSQYMEKITHIPNHQTGMYVDLCKLLAEWDSSIWYCISSEMQAKHVGTPAVPCLHVAEIWDRPRNGMVRTDFPISPERYHFLRGKTYEKHTFNHHHNLCQPEFCWVTSSG